MRKRNWHYLEQHVRFVYIFICMIYLFSGYSMVYAQEKGLDQGLNEIAQQITESIPPSTKQTVAVMDFNDLQGNVTMLGRFVSEELITRLFQSKRFKVIERSLLDKALTELKFNTTDLVDTSNAKQLGKVVGADAIVTGTITDLGQSIKINARIITVESGEVIGAAGTQIVNDSAIRGMLNKPLNSSVGSSQKLTKGIESETLDKETETADLSQEKGPWKTEAKDYFFDLQNCVSSFRSITCNLSVVNKGKDRNLSIGWFSSTGYTTMFDNLGNEYRASKFKLADKSQNANAVTSFLVSGVPVNASFKFEEVSSQATSISLLKIICAYPEGGRRFGIEFRNIPISK